MKTVAEVVTLVSQFIGRKYSFVDSLVKRFHTMTIDTINDIAKSISMDELLRIRSLTGSDFSSQMEVLFRVLKEEVLVFKQASEKLCTELGDLSKNRSRNKETASYQPMISNFLLLKQHAHFLQNGLPVYDFQQNPDFMTTRAVPRFRVPNIDSRRKYSALSIEGLEFEIWKKEQGLKGIHSAENRALKNKLWTLKQRLTALSKDDLDEERSNLNRGYKKLADLIAIEPRSHDASLSNTPVTVFSKSGTSNFSMKWPPATATAEALFGRIGLPVPKFYKRGTLYQPKVRHD